MSSKIILLVEDNDAAREGLAGALHHEGYGVAQAADGQRAFDLMRAGPRPDLVILDLLLPVMDGWEFLQRLRGELRSPVPVLVTTATFLTPPWAESHECAGYLRKPV